MAVESSPMEAVEIAPTSPLATVERDRGLVDRILGGDAEIYRRLVERYQLTILQYAALTTGNNLLADRIAAEGLRAAFAAIARIPQPGHALPFLLKATRSVLLQENQMPPANPRTSAPLPRAQTDAIEETLRRRQAPTDVAMLGMLAALDRLPGPMREVFVLAEALEMSLHDVGYITDTPVSEVSSLLAKANVRMHAMAENTASHDMQIPAARA